MKILPLLPFVKLNAHTWRAARYVSLSLVWRGVGCNDESWGEAQGLQRPIKTSSMRDTCRDAAWPCTVAGFLHQAATPAGFPVCKSSGFINSREIYESLWSASVFLGRDFFFSQAYDRITAAVKWLNITTNSSETVGVVHAVFVFFFNITSTSESAHWEAADVTHQYELSCSDRNL